MPRNIGECYQNITIDHILELHKNRIKPIGPK